MSPATLEPLLEQLGPAVPGIGEISRLADETWAVAYDERTMVMLELADGGRELVLTSAVGAAPEEIRADVFEALLAYNALWSQTGGVRMAAAEGEVLQIAAIATAGLDAQRLGNVLEGFVEKARIWRQYLESGASGADSSGSLVPGLRA